MGKEEVEQDEGRIFAQRLAAAREMRGMSQGGLAEKSGLPPSSISHFEAAKRKPSFANLKRLASALDVSTDYLLGRVENANPAAEADVLFRDAQKLSDEDRKLALDFIRMLERRKDGE
jgi:transcriptional regulator with XRE-family HTH domain